MKQNNVLIKTFTHNNGLKCNVYVPTSDYYSHEHEMSEYFARDILSIFEAQPELKNPAKIPERKLYGKMKNRTIHNNESFC